MLAEQASGRAAWTSDPFLSPGAHAREVPVPVPGSGLWRIELVPAGGTAPVRELVLDGNR